MGWLKTTLLPFSLSVFSLLTGTGEAMSLLPEEDMESRDMGEEEIKSREDSPKGYEFIGRHMLISYCSCDRRALRDLDGLRAAFKEAIKASGATLLDSVEHVFRPDGITILALLSESHASIHTYPEHEACFVDIFTCGRACRAEEFDAILRKYLCAKETNQRILFRHHAIDDDYHYKRLATVRAN